MTKDEIEITLAEQRMILFAQGWSIKEIKSLEKAYKRLMACPVGKAHKLRSPPGKAGEAFKRMRDAAVQYVEKQDKQGVASGPLVSL